MSELLLCEAAGVSTQHHVEEVSEATGSNNVDLISSEESYSHTRCCFRPGAYCFLTGVQSRNGKTEHVFIPQMDNRLIGCFPGHVSKFSCQLLLYQVISFGTDILGVEEDDINIRQRSRSLILMEMIPNEIPNDEALLTSRFIPILRKAT